MTTAEQTIKRWMVVAFVYCLLYSAMTILSFTDSQGELSFLAWVVLAVTLLFWIGTLLAWKGQYRGARVFMLIGGVLALPLGILMIIAGNKIKQAADLNDEAVQVMPITGAPGRP